MGPDGAFTPSPRIHSITFRFFGAVLVGAVVVGAVLVDPVLLDSVLLDSVLGDLVDSVLVGATVVTGESPENPAEAQPERLIRTISTNATTGADAPDRIPALLLCGIGPAVP